MNFDLVEKNKIFEVVSGSHAHGTNTPASDLDIKGHFYASSRSVLSLFKVEKEVGDEKQDIKFYDIAKFLQQLVPQNPISLKFCGQKMFAISTQLWTFCLANEKNS